MTSQNTSGMNSKASLNFDLNNNQNHQQVGSNQYQTYNLNDLNFNYGMSPQRTQQSNKYGYNNLEFEY